MTNVSGNVVPGGTSGVLLQNIPFTPTLVSSTNTQTLTWALNSFPSGTPGYDVLAKLAPSDQVLIVFQVSTSCQSTLVVAQSSVASVDACQKTLTTTEKSRALLTDIPLLEVTKQVKNATLGSGFGNTVFAGVGDTIVWQGVVKNSGRQRVTNLFVQDQLPAGYNFGSASPGISSQSGAPLAAQVA